MSTRFGELVLIDTPYRPDPGSFCKAKDFIDNRYTVQQWYYCREVWHSQLYNLNLFFFSHKANRGHGVAAFMRLIEDKLDVQPRSRFGPTQRKTIMWVEPSRWWTRPTMRRSLYTILLRCGMNYIPDKNNFDHALFSDPYTSNTKVAVERFLAGYTKYTGRRRGWYNQFCLHCPTYASLESLLVRDG